MFHVPGFIDGPAKQKKSWVHVSFTTKGTPVFLRLVVRADDALACPKEATGKEDRLPLVGPLYLANSERKFAMERSVEFAE